jgi:hypothetical protein
MPLKPGARWGEDTPDETRTAAAWGVPDPVDLLSIHYYAAPTRYDPDRVRADLAQWMENAAALGKPLFVGEFGVAENMGRIPPGFDPEAHRRATRDLFRAIYEAGVPLAAYWVYSPKPKHGLMGVISSGDASFDFVLDLMEEYNRKLH